MSLPCPRCGRRSDRRDQQFCGDCGARLLDEARAGAAGSTADRLRAVPRHPDWSLLREHSPSGKGSATGMGCVAAIGLVFSLGASGIAYMAWRRFDPPQPWQWAVVGVAAMFSVAGLAWGLRSLARLSSFLGAELQRVPVAVVGERYADPSGSARSGARALHLVVLEDEHGMRFEKQCTPRVASVVVAGDVAVAYLRGGVLLDLVRVPGA